MLHTQMLFRHIRDRAWLNVSLSLSLFLRLVVGAPVANSSSSSSVHSPGALFRCDITAESRRCHHMHSGVFLFACCALEQSLFHLHWFAVGTLEMSDRKVYCFYTHFSFQIFISQFWRGSVKWPMTLYGPSNSGFDCTTHPCFSGGFEHD